MNRHRFQLHLFVAIAGLIAFCGILYAVALIPPPQEPPQIEPILKAVVRDCAERNTFAVTPAPTLYTNVNGLTDCLWLNGVTVAFATAVHSR